MWGGVGRSGIWGCYSWGNLRVLWASRARSSCSVGPDESPLVPGWPGIRFGPVSSFGPWIPLLSFGRVECMTVPFLSL